MAEERAYERRALSWGGVGPATEVSFGSPQVDEWRLAPADAVLHIRLDGPTTLEVD